MAGTAEPRQAKPSQMFPQALATFIEEKLAAVADIFNVTREVYSKDVVRPAEIDVDAASSLSRIDTARSKLESAFKAYMSKQGSDMKKFAA